MNITTRVSTGPSVSATLALLAALIIGVPPASAFLIPDSDNAMSWVSGVLEAEGVKPLRAGIPRDEARAAALERLVAQPVIESAITMSTAQLGSEPWLVEPAGLTSAGEAALGVLSSAPRHGLEHLTDLSSIDAALVHLAELRANPPHVTLDDYVDRGFYLELGSHAHESGEAFSFDNMLELARLSEHPGFAQWQADATEAYSTWQYEIATAAAYAELLIAHELAELADTQRFANPAWVPGVEHMVPEESMTAIDHEAWRAAQLALTLAETDEFTGLLETLSPPYAQYEMLTDALATYDELARQGGWQTLPEGADLVAIGHRLAVEGFANHEFAADPEHVTSALIAYQHARQLPETGEPDEATLDSLNAPIDERIAQLLVTLDRYRGGFVTDSDESAILVNIADYHGEFWSESERVERWRVMVGKTDWPRNNLTPIMSERIEFVELNPFWYPPARLERNLRPSRSQGIVEYGGRLVQLPGPNNALGRVVFRFPNDDAIYMHDTPHRERFDEPVRAFSSGCVRAQNPEHLAAVLLSRDQGTSLEDARAHVDATIETVQNVHIPLTTPIPIHIEYYTARVADDGQVHFLGDIYEWDAPLMESARERARARLH